MGYRSNSFLHWSAWPQSVLQKGWRLDWLLSPWKPSNHFSGRRSIGCRCSVIDRFNFLSSQTQSLMSIVWNSFLLDFRSNVTQLVMHNQSEKWPSQAFSFTLLDRTCILLLKLIQPKARWERERERERECIFSIATFPHEMEDIFVQKNAL